MNFLSLPATGLLCQHVYRGVSWESILFTIFNKLLVVPYLLVNSFIFDIVIHVLYFWFNCFVAMVYTKLEHFRKHEPISGVSNLQGMVKNWLG